MTTYNALFMLLVTLFAWLPKSWASGVTSHLSPETIVPGQRASLVVELELPSIPDAVKAVEVYDDFITQNPKVTVLERKSRQEGNRIVWIYEVTAYESQAVTLPPIQFKVGPHSYSTESSHLKIEASRTEEDLEIRPGYGEVKLPFPWQYWLRIVFFGSCLVGALALLVYGLNRLPWLRWRRQLSKIRIPEKKESDLVWLRRQIQTLKKRYETDPNPVPIIDELSHVWRTYFTRRLKKPASAYTTAEFQKAIPLPVAQKAVQILQTGDLYKFPERKPNPQQILESSLKLTEETVAKCGR